MVDHGIDIASRSRMSVESEMPSPLERALDRGVKRERWDQVGSGTLKGLDKLVCAQCYICSTPPISGPCDHVI